MRSPVSTGLGLQRHLGVQIELHFDKAERMKSSKVPRAYKAEQQGKV